LKSCLIVLESKDCFENMKELIKKNNNPIEFIFELNSKINNGSSSISNFKS
jgi:hypothetical protein